jgi:hypothetical protein
MVTSNLVTFSFSEQLFPPVRARQNLNKIHKAWANWHIERGEYREALESISNAAKIRSSPGLEAKWLGVRLAPPLLCWAVARDKKAAVRRLGQSAGRNTRSHVNTTLMGDASLFRKPCSLSCGGTQW